MTTIHAVYENGVFRPLSKVELPEHARVFLQIAVDASAIEKKVADHPQAAVWRSLAKSFKGGADAKIAEKHNEHQP